MVILEGTKFASSDVVYSLSIDEELDVVYSVVAAADDDDGVGSTVVVSVIEKSKVVEYVVADEVLICD